MLKTAVKIALYFYQKGHFEFSALLVSRVTDKIIKQLTAAKKKNKGTQTYLNMMMENKMPHLAKDQKLFRHLAKEESDPSAADIKNFYAALHRMKPVVELAERELNSIYGKPTGVKAALIKNKKKVASAALVAVFLLVVVASFCYVQGRRQGLMGHYYDGKTLEQLIRTRLDKTIDFKWQNGPPMHNAPDDHFSVRWEGYLLVKESGNYEFSTLSDDGVRLWIGKNLVINNWTRHYPAWDEGGIKLQEGYYPIKLEYFEHRLSSTIRLFWKPESDSEKSIIPKTHLIPSRRYLDDAKTVHE